jgi:hypothetical protein
MGLASINLKARNWSEMTSYRGENFMDDGPLTVTVKKPGIDAERS